MNAAKLVVKKINANGGVLGQQVELLIEDDVCKPEVATNTATKLVSQKVDVVLGHICSGATKAALGIYKDSKVIVMSPSATKTLTTLPLVTFSLMSGILTSTIMHTPSNIFLLTVHC